jgi:hypothetical protein
LLVEKKEKENKKVYTRRENFIEREELMVEEGMKL